MTINQLDQQIEDNTNWVQVIQNNIDLLNQRLGKEVAYRSTQPFGTITRHFSNGRITRLIDELSSEKMTLDSFKTTLNRIETFNRTGQYS